MDSPDEQDIANLLSAFRWLLPDNYWRARFPKKDVVFEFKDLIHRETDWLYLYLGVLCLLKMSHGLRHRQRILEILTSMHHVFEGLKEE